MNCQEEQNETDYFLRPRLIPNAGTRAKKEEVAEAIRNGEKITAKHKRDAYRRNFQFNHKWANKFYHIKQVMPVVKEGEQGIVVITVYTFYF